MSNRNTKRVDENRTMRRDLTLSASAKKPALSQADNSKGRKAGKRKLNNPNVTPVSKVSKVSKVNKVNKVNKGESAHLTDVNAVSSGSKSVAGKAANPKTLLGTSPQTKPAIKQLVREHSELAMRAAKRIKASKNKRKTSHLVCQHLCMMLNSPISSTSPSFRQATLTHRAVSVNEPLAQCFLPI